MKERFDELIEHLLKGNVFLQEAIELLERRMIEGALAGSGGNRCVASKQLGIHRNTLQRKMVDYSIGNGRARRKPVAAAGRSRKGKRGAA